ncbi:hypothetical protein [Bacillus altitudinis]|uniref:hypothetical protein n=1 Tax=Bacillus altitudinis TaxID=293387 RepID=UPI002FFD9079
MKILLDRNYLVDHLGLPLNAVLKEIVETSRWSIHYRIVFAYQDKFYETTYKEGATELQEESPWEYDDQVECFEVELKEVMVKKWVRKDLK